LRANLHERQTEESIIDRQRRCHERARTHRWEIFADFVYWYQRRFGGKQAARPLECSNDLRARPRMPWRQGVC
jgi:hypothetical protein